MGFLKDVPDLHTQPIRDIIFERLRKAIVQGELAPDTYFTDAALAEDFGVSRTPVREAVQKLEMAGYIERVPMRGNRVLGLSPHELAYSFAIRKALETLALQYSAIQITDETLRQVSKILDELEAIVADLSGEERLERAFPLVKKYNELVFEACGSEHLTGLIWAQREIFDRYRVIRSVLPSRVEQSVSRRRDLYEALKARDPERAKAIWSKHLGESFSIWQEKSGYTEELKDFPFL